MSKTTNTPRLSILFVEDDPGEREEVRKKLRNAFPHAKIGSAQSSRAAINKFRKTPFDVLVIDMKLKKGTGIDVVTELKMTTDHSFRSIAYSAYPKKYGMKAWKARFDAFVEKTITSSIEELIEEIQNQIAILEKYRRMFCSMPFDKGFDGVFFGIKSAAHDAHFTCERNDEKTFTGEIIEEVRDNIQEADLMVAVLTGGNQNVYYEVGYADAIEKEVVLVAESIDDLQFNLRSRPCITYGGDIRKLNKDLKEKLLELGKKMK